MAFPKKTSVLGQSLCLPPTPPPVKNREFYFYCRLAVSEICCFLAESLCTWAIPPVRLGLPGRNSGKTPETLSERFLEFPSRVRLGCPKPYNSRHSRLPERFQNSLPPSTAGNASFFRIGSGEGLSELVMEFPAVLGGFLALYRSAPKMTILRLSW